MGTRDPTCRVSDPDTYVGAWVWAFPASYLVHIAEEYWAPPGFPAWASGFLGIGFTSRVFVVANALFFALMLLAVALVLRGAWRPWVAVALGAAVGINGLVHLLGTAVSRTYSPGLLSGVLLWLPLCAVALVRASRRLGRRAWRRGIVVGIILHLSLPVVGIALSWLLNP